MRNQHNFGSILLIVLLATQAIFYTLPVAAQANRPGPFNAAIYQGLKWRNVGPFRGGRAVAVTGIHGNDQVYFMGTAGGGVWRTDDAGVSWQNVSDGYFNSSSIGAITVAPSDPNVIYVGTGEHSVRGVMTSAGDGLYKSTDGGRTWKQLDMDKSRHISAIVVHPTDPNLLYVAVQGAAFGPSQERGVFRSLDGGDNWEHVFFINETTGASDLCMDPFNPRVLYVGMWDHMRQPWEIRSGGPGSGLYRTSDGGNNWMKLGSGLPEKLGKTAIAASPAQPDLVYAVLEADKGGVFRSENGGSTWQQVSSDRVSIARAWYYTEIIADPRDPQTVYVLNAPLLKSTDGGKTFNNIPSPHSDHHGLWINPDAPENMVLANDGGACVTFNGGGTWSSQMNQPTAQIYRVIADKELPFYTIYGAQQDHTTLAIPSQTVNGGITYKDMFEVGGGESAFIAFNPEAPRNIAAGSYQGNITLYDRVTRHTRDVMSYPTVGLATLPRDMKYRFNWNAPIMASPQDPRVLYHAAQKVLRSRDEGRTWQEISPDLTRNDVNKQGPGGRPFTNEGAGGENYNTISYLACSPHQSWVIWVGSDDGLVHVTQDEGQTWINVTPPDLGEALINSIEVSPHKASRAYVVATRSKFNDFTPLVYRTDNFGATWTLINKGFGAEDITRVVREDPLRENLLYAGTETGLYISYNGGEGWHRFQLNLPVCPVTDLTIRNNDLIAATAGRGFWILDELSFLQESAGYLLAKTPKLFSMQPVYRPAALGTSPKGAGENPLSGLIIDYFLPARLDSALIKLEILAEDGTTVIRTYSSDATEHYKSYPGGPPKPEALPKGYGIHRFHWDLRHAPIPHVEDLFVLGDYQGGLVAPGAYTVRLIVEGKAYTESVSVLPDPRLVDEIQASDYKSQRDIMQDIAGTISDIHQSVAVMHDLRDQMEILKRRLERLSGQPDLEQKAIQILDHIRTWEMKLVQPEQKTYQDVINFPNRLNAELMDLHARCDGPDPRVSQGARQRLTDLKAEWSNLAAERDTIINVEMQSFNQLYSERQLPALFLPTNGRTLDSW